jgi:GTP pyrophosphokinase
MATAVLSELIPGWTLSGEALDRLDVDLLARAYRFSERAHANQVRQNGKPFITHCVEVAKSLAELGLDSTTVACGLLHDVVEDTNYDLTQIEREFGKKAAEIVDGLTKIGHLPLTSSEERQVESYRKLLLSIAKDARVILIKLADRLHNMRTLEFLPPDKQQRIAQETRDLYAPLAHRFGMAKMRWELEDLAFKFLEPKEYKELAALVATKRKEREALVAELAGPLEKKLRDAKINVHEVAGRAKHLWSIHRKMEKRDKPYDEIYDLLAVRVLVDNVQECYHALGVIHEGWTPLQERFKDYIASPKANGYQSLHTTIFGPRRSLFEIQIRTKEMHRMAEHGIAAYWRYKDNTRTDDELDRALQWFRQVLEMQLDAKTPAEFLEFLKLDLYQDEIFVFTPTGDVIQLPKGATPLDFAFAVHTEIGLHCAGAKVDGRIVQLARELKNSEMCEIITSPHARPSRDWMSHVRTGRARHKVRQWLRNEEQRSSTQLGQEILDRELRRRKHPLLSADDLAKIAKLLQLTDTTHLLASIAQGDVSVTQVLRALHPEQDEKQEPALRASPLERLVERFRGRAGKAIRIQGADGLMVRYAQCCQPVPGDSVVGYVTRGRGVSIHRADCPNLLMLAHEPERRLDIDWQEGAGERFLVRLAMAGFDRRNLYADLAAAMSTTGNDIRSLELHTVDGRVTGSAVVEVENLNHLKKIIAAARRVKGITEIQRRERLSEDES